MEIKSRAMHGQTCPSGCMSKVLVEPESPDSERRSFVLRVSYSVRVKRNAAGHVPGCNVDVLSILRLAPKDVDYRYISNGSTAIRASTSSTAVSFCRFTSIHLRCLSAFAPYISSILRSTRRCSLSVMPLYLPSNLFASFVQGAQYGKFRRR